MSKLVLEKNTDNLPQGWIYGKIHDVVPTPKIDIVDGPFGSNLKATEYVDHGIPIIRLQNVDRYQFINKNIRYITKEKAEQLKRHSFSKNDIVITKLGDPVGKACLVPEYLEKGIIVADILRMRILDEFISRKFLMYLINSEIIIKQFANHTRGTTRPRVNLTKFRDFTIPLPPLNEQKRIVAKIEELFSILDKNYVILNQNKNLLEHYKKSILTLAFQGTFGGNGIYKKKGKEFKSEIDFELLPSLDTMYLENTPQHWKIKRLGSISTLYVPMRDKPKKFDGDIPWLRIEDLDGKYASYSKSNQNVSDDTVKKMKLRIYPRGTVICSCSATIGVCAITKNKLITNQTFIGIHPSDILDKEFLYYFLISQTNNLYKIGTGTTILYISRKKFENFPIVIPEIAEQKEIVKIIEKHIAYLDNLRNLIDFVIKQNSKLYKSILNRAFNGKLVSQDPRDESAEVLLQKIKQEKQKIINSKPRKKKNDK